MIRFRFVPLLLMVSLLVAATVAEAWTSALLMTVVLG